MFCVFWLLRKMFEVLSSLFFWASYSLNNRRKSVFFLFLFVLINVRELFVGIVMESLFIIFFLLLYLKFMFLNFIESFSFGTTSAGAFFSFRIAFFFFNKWNIDVMLIKDCCVLWYIDFKKFSGIDSWNSNFCIMIKFFMVRFFCATFCAARSIVAERDVEKMVFCLKFNIFSELVIFKFVCLMFFKFLL